MKKEDELLDHNYDGIQEYDNDLPRWWVWLFWLSTILGVIYAIYFHNPSTPTPLEQLSADLNEISAMKQAAAPTQADTEPTNDELMKLVVDSTRQASGKSIFAAKCMPCHGENGQGIIGPNLTDDYWIHGGSPVDMRAVIINGVPAKGMLAWKGILSNDDINSLVAFVWSIHGTNPPGAKAAEGAVFKR